MVSVTHCTKRRWISSLKTWTCSTNVTENIDYVGQNVHKVLPRTSVGSCKFPWQERAVWVDEQETVEKGDSRRCPRLTPVFSNLLAIIYRNIKCIQHFIFYQNKHTRGSRKSCHKQACVTLFSPVKMYLFASQSYKAAVPWSTVWRTISSLYISHDIV